MTKFRRSPAEESQALRVQRDLYKYIHDQTVRMMNQGFAPSEIAETLVQPPGLEHEWSTRGYDGTLSGLFSRRALTIAPNGGGSRRC